MIKNGFALAYDVVFDLIKSVYQSTDLFAGDFQQEYASIDVLDGYLRDVRTRPGSLFLVAGDGKQLLGYLLVVPKVASKLRHTAELTMGVLEQARGKGVGTELLRAALSQLRSDGIIEIVYLMVRADNYPTTRLYRKNGFEELATLTRDTKIGTHYDDGVLMRIHVRDDVRQTPQERQPL